MRRNVLARILLDSILVIVVAMLLGGIGGFLYSATEPRSYDATARVMVVADRDRTSGLSDDLANAYLSEGRVRNYRSLLTSPALLQRSITFHGLPTTATYLEQNLTVTSPRSTSLIDVTISSSDRQLAADSASAIAREFVAAASELEQAGYLHAVLVHDAPVPAKAAHPRTWPNVINGGLALAVASAALSVLVGRRNPKLRYLTDVRTVGGVEVIGSIPVRRRLFGLSKRSERLKRAADGKRLDAVAEVLRRRVKDEPGAIELVPADHRLGAVMTGLLSSRFADTVSVRNASQNPAGAVALQAPPTAVRLGVIPSACRWKDAAAFARKLKADGGQAFVILVNGR